MGIHPTAVIEEGVEIGADVEIGPYSLLESGVRVGAQCRLASHTIVRAHSVLGQDVRVDSFAVIGGDPQMAGFDRSVQSHVEIGDHTEIREAVTVHRSAEEQGVTRVGANCMLMANAHIAHDCEVGDHVTIGNNVLLAGQVSIGDHTFMGGGSGVHQFVRIGESVMVGGNATITTDVPSFCIVARYGRLYGLNRVGVRRRGFSIHELRDLKACFHAVFQSRGGNPVRLAREIRESNQIGTTAPGRRFVESITETKRGYPRLATGD